MFDKHSQKRIWVRVLILICCSIGGHGMSHAAGIKEKPYDLSGLPKELANKIDDQRRELVRFKIALLAYAAKHNELPRKIADVLGPETGLEMPPRDLFRQSMTITYVVQSNMQEAVFYSYGPDGKDDKGADLKTPVAKGTTPEGDIVDSIGLAALAAKRDEDKELRKPLYDKLVEARRKSGRDNAIVHYMESAWKMGELSYDFDKYERDLIGSTLKQGWTGQSKPLIGVLARNREAMAEARKGIALDEAVNDFDPHGFNVNISKVYQISTLICAEGLWLESIGKPADAMNDYLSALTMGRDLGRPNPDYSQGFISVAMQASALKQIVRLSSNVSLGRSALERTAERLKKIEATQGSVLNWFECYNKSWYATIEKERRESPKKIAERMSENSISGDDTKKAIEDSSKLADAIEIGLKKTESWNRTMLGTPYWECAAKGYGPADYEKLIDRENLKSAFLFNWNEVKIRQLWLKAALAEARCAVALQVYRRSKGGYPDTLAGLVPELLEKVPIDPFSGQPLLYRADGASYILWSIGPDMKSNAAMISYDPTNGSESVGDILQTR